MKFCEINEKSLRVKLTRFEGLVGNCGPGCLTIFLKPLIIFKGLKFYKNLNKFPKIETPNFKIKIYFKLLNIKYKIKKYLSPHKLLKSHSDHPQLNPTKQPSRKLNFKRKIISIRKRMKVVTIRRARKIFLFISCATLTASLTTRQ